MNRPDVAERNRILKTRQFPHKNCEGCGGSVLPKKFSKKRVQNARFCGQACYWQSMVGLTGRFARNWQGGKSSEAEIVRSSREYAEWRKAVFERDGYACTKCGDASGGNLHADHIKQFAYYPHLRLEVSNGRTLCEPCHKLTDTWANNKPTYAKAA